MTIGDVLNEAWTLYTKFFARFLVIALIVFAVVNAIYALLVVALEGDSDGAAAFLAVIGLAASLIGTFWLQGALVYAVQDVRDGTFDTKTGDVFRRVTPFLGTLVGAGLLAGLGIGLGFVLLVAPGLYLLTIWAVIAPAIVIEGKGIRESFGRSRELVRGFGWTVFAIVLITALLSGIASALLQAAFAFLPRYLEIFVGGTLAQAVTAPFMAVALTVLFFRLRDAKDETTDAPATES